MAKSLSPLRYPGGKSKIYEKVKNLIEATQMGDKTYVEPFAGGFGMGISLLCDKVVPRAILNDYDSHIYHFWYAVLHHTKDLKDRIINTPITIEERENQKIIYNENVTDVLDDAFATLFLNRVNYSGILNGGPIGGLLQEGTYKLDCRFNKDDIIKKIENVAALKDRIELYNCDASDLIINQLNGERDRTFFNIDPPYVQKGSRLYKNYFMEPNHRNLEQVINEHLTDTPWIVTYDDCPLIKEIYEEYHMQGYDILHNAGGSVQGKELVITNIAADAFVW